jgi:hypothetical protein
MMFLFQIERTEAMDIAVNNNKRGGRGKTPTASLAHYAFFWLRGT